MVRHKHSSHCHVLVFLTLIEVNALVISDAKTDLAVVDVGTLSRGCHQVGVGHVLEPGTLAVVVSIAVGRVRVQP